jgi:hypothetical protein
VQPDIGGQPIGRLAAIPVDVGRLTGQFAARPEGLAQSTGQLTVERGVGGLSTGQLTAERGVGRLSTGQLTAERGVGGQPDRQRATQAGVNGQSAIQQGVNGQTAGPLTERFGGTTLADLLVVGTALALDTPEAGRIAVADPSPSERQPAEPYVAQQPTSATNGAGTMAEQPRPAGAADPVAELTVDAGAPPSAEPEPGAEADADAHTPERSSGRNRHAGTPSAARGISSKPVSEMSFAELLAGALDAYRES